MLMELREKYFIHLVQIENFANMSFRVGQEVVCIKDHSQGVIKKGQTFIIKSIKTHVCGCVGYDLGIKTDKPLMGCGIHPGITKDTSGIHWIAGRILAPIDDGFADRVLEKIKEQIYQYRFQSFL